MEHLIDLQLPRLSNGVEMLALEGGAEGYTSLRDLLPTSPASVASPSGGGSWKEIPFRDPLLQHAAWAYLQPIAEARGGDGRRPWWWLRGDCGGVLGCLSGVVLVVVKGLFGRRPESAEEDKAAFFI
ncbi:Unknown protein [Striga hermonthica]|uniref:Uncharacterized protein n=1 Tax=Striga hermonthica TaxID=68872 RepID=A0A9N7NA02_STRHE|nr:Unknown protein [Striga hermonthica]